MDLDGDVVTDAEKTQVMQALAVDLLRVALDRVPVGCATILTDPLGSVTIFVCGAGVDAAQMHATIRQHMASAVRLTPPQVVH